MIWAIIRMKIISRRHRTLREQANQQMILLHLVTMLVYLVVLTLHTVFVFIWIDDESTHPNKVFLSLTTLRLCQLVVQLVLVWLFLGFSKV